jgi:hypothetical protein
MALDRFTGKRLCEGLVFCDFDMRSGALVTSLPGWLVPGIRYVSEDNDVELLVTRQDTRVTFRFSRDRDILPVARFRQTLYSAAFLAANPAGSAAASRKRLRDHVNSVELVPFPPSSPTHDPLGAASSPVRGACSKATTANNNNNNNTTCSSNSSSSKSRGPSSLLEFIESRKALAEQPTDDDDMVSAKRQRTDDGNDRQATATMPPPPPAPSMLPPPPPPPPLLKQASQNGKKLRPLRWSSIPAHKLEATVWGRKDMPRLPSNNSLISQQEVESLFSISPVKRSLDASERAKPQTLIDLKRSNNISIALTQFSHLTFDQVKDALLLRVPLRDSTSESDDIRNTRDTDKNAAHSNQTHTTTTTTTTTATATTTTSPSTSTSSTKDASTTIAASASTDDAVAPAITLTVDQLVALQSIFPITIEERRVLLGKINVADTLPLAERFLMHFLDVANPDRKAQALLFVDAFEAQATELLQGVASIRNACDEMQRNERLPQLLRIILVLGSVLNRDTYLNSCGFRLQSLRKLGETRTRRKGHTALNYLAKVAHEYNADILHFAQDLPHCAEAAEIDLDDLSALSRSLANGLELVAAEIEYERCSADPDLPETRYLQTLRAFHATATSTLNNALEQLQQAHQTFAKVSEYFGEDTAEAQVKSTEFFSILTEFSDSLLVCPSIVVDTHATNVHCSVYAID